MTQNSVVKYEDDETNEFVDASVVPFGSPLMTAILSGSLPSWLSALVDKHSGDPEGAEDEYSRFSGASPMNLKEKLEKSGPFTANVHGVLFLPHDRFTGMDNQEHEGYWRAFILTDEKDPDTGNYRVYVSSSKGLFQHLALAIQSRCKKYGGNAGFGVWPEPTQYRFSAGAKGAHFMNRVDRPKPSTNKG